MIVKKAVFVKVRRVYPDDSYQDVVEVRQLTPEQIAELEQAKTERLLFGTDEKPKQ